MALIRWDPFRDLLGLQERMNKLFDESFRGMSRTGSEDDWALGGTWAPAVDIYEQGSDIVLKAELPGVDPKSVDVRLENNTLTLCGERKFDDEIQRENYHRIERSYGAFSRSFTLPSTVDQNNIKADYRDGVLRVTLPKREEAKPKQISINVAKS